MPNSRVTLKIGGQDRTVIFDFVRLEAIEKAVGKNVIQIIVDHIMPLVGVEADLATLSPEMLGKALGQMSIGFLGRFIAGCLDIPLESLGTTVPLSDTMRVFTTLFGGFAEAVKQLSGSGEDGANPPAASTASAPGAASSSV